MSPIVVPAETVPCPVCSVPFVEHHVTRWYGSTYDVWSYKAAEAGVTCFRLDRANYPPSFRERSGRMRRGPLPTRAPDAEKLRSRQRRAALA
jgi:hypothetical protein